jgi:hypothetical protein
MKKKLTIIIGSLLCMATPIALTIFTVSAPVALTGCVTNITTNSQAAIAATALILQNAAEAGATAAITPPNGNTNNAVYFQLASQAIGTFLTGSNYTPGAFQQALMNVKVPALNNLWVQLAVGTLVDLYGLYYAQYVDGQIAGNTYASQFLTAIQTGFNQALGTPAGLKAKKPIELEQVLPRRVR